MNTYFLTTPIYYVNARPHLGHAYTSIVADCMTRFKSLMGFECSLLTGTDEHGDKIVKAAAAAGMPPAAFTDKISAEFQALLPVLNVNNQHFVRTTDPEHKECVQHFLQKVYESGDIYFGEYGGHYCYGCERFYTEKELEDGLCPQHQAKPEYISEKNYFFKMSKYQDWLKQYILDNPDFIRPERYRNEALALLEAGALEDLCISRPKSRLEWGIELPFDKEYVCYVWFDALLGYISPLAPFSGPSGKANLDGANFKSFWHNAEHLIAKDILKPHAIFWPTMLKAAGLEPYQHLNVHGYWLVRDTKMSKSLGNVVDPLELVKKYGVDSFRYFLMREMHFGSDASFSEDAFVSRLNSDLANDLGNLVSRVLSMLGKYREGLVPGQGKAGEEEQNLKSLALNSFTNYQTLFNAVRFSNALESLWELVRALNKYVDSSAPWALYKEGNTEKLDAVLRTILECLRKIALHLWPIMPETAVKMLEQLGQHTDFTNVRLDAELENFDLLTAGVAISTSSNLFPRIELEKPIEKPTAGKEKSKKSPEASANVAKSVAVCSDQGNVNIANIEFADFTKLDLRVGTVLSCTNHPNADKLLCFEIDLGEDKPRSIVSGIAAHFSPESLIGQQVVVVANLPPRKLRGVESQGMILTAENASSLSLLTPSRPMAAGSKVL